VTCHQNRAAVLLDVLEDVYQLCRIVAVDGAEIPKAEGFEQHARRDNSLQSFFQTDRDAADPISPNVHLSGQFVNVFFSRLYLGLAINSVK